jgi:hypothetical protein
MVGDMPDRNDRNTQFGVRPGVTAFHPVERIFRRECGEDIVGVVEGILEILDQLGFALRGSTLAWSQPRNHHASALNFKFQLLIYEFK